MEQVLHRAIRQHWTIENKGHWALDMAFNQDRLQCTNAQYLAGRTLLNKIALNFTTKIQTRLEETTGKEAPSKPVIRARHLAAPWAKVSLQKETLIVVFYLISDASDLKIASTFSVASR